MSSRWEGELRGEVGQDHSLQIWRPNDEALLQVPVVEKKKSRKAAPLLPSATTAQAQAPLPQVALPPAPLTSAATSLYIRLLKSKADKEAAAAGAAAAAAKDP